MKNDLAEVTKLLYDLAGGFEYRPPSYTCIQEFTDSFEKSQQVKPEYTASPPVAQPEWQPHQPYPRIYTKGYKKTLLSTL